MHAEQYGGEHIEAGGEAASITGPKGEGRGVYVMYVYVMYVYVMYVYVMYVYVCDGVVFI